MTNNTLDFTKISNLVQTQFPSFYEEKGPNFILFVKAYFEWLEQQNNITYHSRRLRDYFDIDRTPEDFIVHFKNTFLQDIQFNINTDKRLLIKNVLDLYRSKGSEQSFRLFFKLVFGEDIDIYYPNEDILKASDNTWVIPTYLEVTPADNNEKFAGKQIFGLTSKASAFVDRIVKRKIPSKWIHLFYITNITGNFETGEILSFDGTAAGNPYILGSLSNTAVIDGSTGYSQGQVVNLISNTGLYGQAIVSQVQDQTGLVDFEIVDGGFGYETDPDVFISQKVLTLSNISVANNLLPPFDIDEDIIEPLANIEFYNYTANTSFAVGDIVENYYANDDVAGQGKILAVSQSPVLNTGSMFISVLSGNVNYDATFSLKGNTITATINTYSDQTAVGNLLNISNIININVSTVANTFKVGETVVIYDSSNTVISNSSVISFVSSPLVNSLKLETDYGYFYPNTTIKGLTSNSSANITGLSMQIGVYGITEAYSNLSGNYLYGNTLSTNAVVTSISSGFGATFAVSTLNNQETVVLNSDVLSGNNSAGIEYLNLTLDGSDSGVTANGYGFPLNTAAGPEDYFSTYLSLQEVVIGTVASLGNVNPGIDYNVAPIVKLEQPQTEIYNRQDEILNISNISSGFTVGEIITQNIPLSNTATLILSETNPFYLSEIVYQSNGTSNIAIGETFSANGATVVIINKTGNFTNTYSVVGVSSGKSSGVSNADNSSITRIAKGIIKDASNNSVMYVRRLTLFDNFVSGINITGLQSGFTANVDYVDIDYLSSDVGIDATISANVVTGSGYVTAMTIYDSGLGYVNTEITTFANNELSTVGSVRLYTGTQGHSAGHFASSKSFLSSNKYFQDNYYYQTFSYQIESALNFDEYAEMLNKVLHPSGLQMFGAVKKITDVDISLSSAEFDIVSANS